MFGKEYANHLDLLTRLFGQMSHKYQEKIKTSKKNTFIEKLKKNYISIFGIPEIGFQVRSIYFSDILSTHVFNKYPKNILDAGCGIGLHTFWLGKKFNKAEVLGGDIDTHKLKFCKVLAGKLHIKNVSFAHFDIIEKPKVADYDLIVNIDVLEHIENYKLALVNLSKLLRKSGYLYVHVPQPNQKRIFNLIKNWHHEDHVREGISKIDLETLLKKTGFKIIVSKDTFGFSGKLAWEINHLILKRSFILAGITFPFLYLLAMFDVLGKNKNGLGIAILAKKNN